MDDIATQFLAAYAAGSMPEGGWKFGKALQQAQLDYTPESLNRLDALLTQIRDRAKPTRADLDTEQGRNFESLVVFYVIEIARRLSNAHFQWHDRASALRALPPGLALEDTPATRLVVDAPAHAALFRPLAWLEGRLLDGGGEVRTADYIAGVLAQLKRDGAAIWWSAMFGAGRLGSWQIMMAADGRGIWPARIVGSAPTVGRNVERGDLQRAVDWGRYQLTDNPDGEPWQVFSFPGYAEHAGERVDAVIVLAATYGEHPMRLSIAFPFRPARDGQRLVILQPSLLEATLPVETVGQLGPALERGIRSLQWEVGGSWNELYQA